MSFLAFRESVVLTLFPSRQELTDILVHSSKGGFGPGVLILSVIKAFGYIVFLDCGSSPILIPKAPCTFIVDT